MTEQAQQRVKALLEGAIDIVKASPDPLPLLLAGGGAILAPSDLRGASELKLPPYAGPAGNWWTEGIRVRY